MAYRGYKKPGIKAGSPASKDGFKVPQLGRTSKTATAGSAIRAYCGAKKRSGGGGKCRRPAGWGTQHPGIGKCRLHGGTAPSHVRAAASEEYRRLLGTPMEINPLEAIIWCIKIRAGEVKWLTEKLGELKKEEWTEDTLVGKQFHLFARERQHAMADLARFSQMAISLGLSERSVKMAETYGELLARYTQGLLNDLWPHLDEAGRAQAPKFVRQRLLELDEGRRTPVAELPMAASA